MNEEKYANEFALGMMKLYVKTLTASVICVAAGAILVTAGKGKASLYLLPFVASLIPFAMFLYYLWMFRKDKLSVTPVVLKEKKKDIAGGLLSGMSLSHKKYIFEFTDEEEKNHSFYISRSGWINTFEVGKKYIVVHRASAIPSESNCFEFVLMKEEGEDEADKGDN